MFVKLNLKQIIMSAKNEKIKECYDLINGLYKIKYEEIAPIFDALTAIQSRQIIIDFGEIKNLHNKVTEPECKYKPTYKKIYIPKYKHGHQPTDELDTSNPPKP